MSQEGKLSTCSPREANTHFFFFHFMVKKVKTASAVRLSRNKQSHDVAQGPWSAMGTPAPIPSLQPGLRPAFHALPQSTASQLLVDPPSCSQQLRAVLSPSTASRPFSAAGFQRCILLWRHSCAPCSCPITLATLCQLRELLCTLSSSQFQ